MITFTSDALTEPLKISGQPMVHLVASTSGTDADWVVKLIDVYPDEVYAQPEMGGYQLAVGMDILRGRYRESFVDAQAHQGQHAARPIEFRLLPRQSRFPAGPPA